MDISHLTKSELFAMRFEELLDQLYSKKVDPGLIRAQAWKLTRMVQDQQELEKKEGTVRTLGYAQLLQQLEVFDAKIVMALLSDGI